MDYTNKLNARIKKSYIIIPPVLSGLILFISNYFSVKHNIDYVIILIGVCVIFTYLLVLIFYLRGLIEELIKDVDKLHKTINDDKN